MRPDNWFHGPPQAAAEPGPLGAWQLFAELRKIQNMCAMISTRVSSAHAFNKWQEILMSQAKSTTAAGETAKGFTDEEKAAMQERAKELKAEARANKDRAAGEATCSPRSPRCRNQSAPGQAAP